MRCHQPAGTTGCSRSTGSHTQFYDKFKYRAIVCDIVFYIWHVPEFQASLVHFVRSPSQSLRFINMVVNDMIYHMDEALKLLADIRVGERATDSTSANEDAVTNGKLTPAEHWSPSSNTFAQKLGSSDALLPSRGSDASITFEVQTTF